ncbi:Glycosylase OS=Planctomyces maris DSM 8797 GN=PM8797T_29039 PE=4 SV=1 [Gemmata massiliana]|uniref:Glycosylase n=1 Tax=Gemmata massiliana TaxID=1210884 RepID=A0A6P2DAW4_9BACT|nr:glycosylase [Gemmata massiliana]VTR98047.1 Glycosylase OS=Planctomyces maris DSM 8797 GN=PM8797T_29039 PE=4 SV=1 [Gemmata massiliana]
MRHIPVRRLSLLFAAALVFSGCRPAAGPVPTAPALEQPVPKQSGFPQELVSFVQQGDGPVFQAAGAGHWDVKIRERGWIIREDSGYKLWYTGYDGTANGRRMLGLVTSPDGVTWTRHPGNPLVRDHWVEDVMVVKDGGRYLMFAEGENDRAQLLTSPDGMTWEKLGRIDVRLASGAPVPDGPYGTPAAFKDGDRWLLFYERSDKGVWLAASNDLKVWTNVRDEPVLVPGPGAYDRDMIALNQVIKHGGRYYAYYHGCATSGPDARKWSTAIAASDDLVNWEKFPGNPLLPVAENKSSGILVDTGAGFRLYTMHPAVYLHVPGPR